MHKLVQAIGAVVALALAYWAHQKSGDTLRATTLALQVFAPFLAFGFLLQRRKAQAESGLTEAESIQQTPGGKEKLESAIKSLRLSGNFLVALPILIALAVGFTSEAAYGVMLLLLTGIIMWPTAALLFYAARKQEALLNEPTPE